MDKVTAAFEQISAWCRAHPKATTVIAALLVGMAIGIWIAA